MAAAEPYPLAERLRAQLLAGRPAPGPVEAVDRLLAVQAQDPRGARLAVRARTRRGVLAADVDRALDDGALVIGWLMRGTLHLVRSEDYRWLHALCAPRLVAQSVRRLAQEGVDPAMAERGVRAIERALTSDGPLTRDQLAERVASARVRVEGQAFLHVLFRAGNEGIVVRGPMAGARQAFVLARDWLGPPAPMDRDPALAELARRYLAGHGPASDRDLARWSGLSLGDARAGLAAIAGELRTRRDGLHVLRSAPSRTPALPRPRLLGAFEPLLLGWRTREPLVGRHMEAVGTGGIIRPVALVNGRVAAIWKLSGEQLTIEPLERIGRADTDALETDAADVRRFLARGR